MPVPSTGYSGSVSAQRDSLSQATNFGVPVELDVSWPYPETADVVLCSLTTAKARGCSEPRKLVAATRQVTGFYRILQQQTATDVDSHAHPPSHVRLSNRLSLLYPVARPVSSSVLEPSPTGSGSTSFTDKPLHY